MKSCIVSLQVLISACGRRTSSDWACGVCGVIELPGISCLQACVMCQISGVTDPDVATDTLRRHPVELNTVVMFAIWPHPQAVTHVVYPGSSSGCSGVVFLRKGESALGGYQ